MPCHPDRVRASYPSYWWRPSSTAARAVEALSRAWIKTGDPVFLELLKEGDEAFMAKAFGQPGVAPVFHKDLASSEDSLKTLDRMELE